MTEAGRDINHTFHILCPLATAAQAEGTCRTMKSKLRKRMNAAGSNWGEISPLARIHIRAKECRSIGFSLNETLMGRPIRLGDKMINLAQAHLATVSLSEAWVQNLQMQILQIQKSGVATDEAKVWFDAKGHITEHQIRPKVMIQDQAPYHPFPKVK